MFLITLVNQSGHTVGHMLSPLSRPETELMLTERGWKTESFSDNIIWQKEGEKISIQLKEVQPLPPAEISRKLLEFESA